MTWSPPGVPLVLFNTSPKNHISTWAAVGRWKPSLCITHHRFELITTWGDKTEASCRFDHASDLCTAQGTKAVCSWSRAASVVVSGLGIKTDSVAQTLAEAGLWGMEEGRYKTEDRPFPVGLLASVPQMQWLYIFLKKNKDLFLFYKYACFVSLYVCLYILCVPCLRGPEEGSQFPRVGVVVTGVSHHRGAGSWSWVL